MISFGMDIYHIDKIDVADSEYVITFDISKLVVRYITRIVDNNKIKVNKDNYKTFIGIIHNEIVKRLIPVDVDVVL